MGYLVCSAVLVSEEGGALREHLRTTLKCESMRREDLWVSRPEFKCTTISVVPHMWVGHESSYYRVTFLCTAQDEML